MLKKLFIQGKHLIEAPEKMNLALQFKQLFYLKHTSRGKIDSIFLDFLPQNAKQLCRVSIWFKYLRKWIGPYNISYYYIWSILLAAKWNLSIVTKEIYSFPQFFWLSFTKCLKSYLNRVWLKCQKKWICLYNTNYYYI